jgi:hypothetical protein
LIKKDQCGPNHPRLAGSEPCDRICLAWLVHERGIEPHIPVFDNSQRTDGTYSRDDFTDDHKHDCYICPAGKELRQRQKIYRLPRPFVDENGMMRIAPASWTARAVR